MKKKILFVTVLLLISSCARKMDSSSFLPSIISSSDIISSIESTSEISTSSSEVIISSSEEKKALPFKIHFINLLLDNNATSSQNGDCILIQYGNIDILIDAGGTTGVGKTSVLPYLKNKISDGIIEYVIASHADADHITNFACSKTDNEPDIKLRYPSGVLTNFTIENIITFNYVHTSLIYKNFMEVINYNVEKGANYCTINQNLDNNDNLDTNPCKKNYYLDDFFSINFLYTPLSYSGTGSNDNNKSVVVLIKFMNKSFLFAGDNESSGEKAIVDNNDLEQVTMFKAGHHGSKASNTAYLLEKITPSIVMIPSSNYQNTASWDFPTQDALNNILKQTSQVYATFLNGNIVYSIIDGTEEIKGSYNDTILENTPWFIANRVKPN